MIEYVEKIAQLENTDRINRLKGKTLEQERCVSIEQAMLITKAWKEYSDKSIILRRAYAFKEAALNLEIDIDEDEIIVGNRSVDPAAGIVFPEGGLNWLVDEIDQLPNRDQDKFNLNSEDREIFFSELVPFWKGKSLEDNVYSKLTREDLESEVVGKLNQKDHAQGHICPNASVWLERGPSLLLTEAEKALESCSTEQRDYYQASVIVLDAACQFIERYADFALELSQKAKSAEDLISIEKACRAIAKNPPSSFQEATQSLWFLMVLLQIESNASSFSPGRVDQYLYQYLINDLEVKRLSLEKAQEILDAFFIKFNQIVYLRNAKGASFFAGFPIGFNIAIGGKKTDGDDATNLLSYMLLKSQEHVRMRQPNLSARLHSGSPDEFVRRVSEVISLGTGMPQVFSDESVVPALIKAGYSENDAINYAIVGCVELSTHGNTLGFSDAAMFNIVKLLELTLNNGKCLQTGKQLGLELGSLKDFQTYEQLEGALEIQMEYFIAIMTKGLEIVEESHKESMPSPFLSSVINNCLKKGMDVTAGGAKYNFSGVQLIQVANLADSLAAIKILVFDEKKISAETLMNSLKNNYADENIRMLMLYHAPKYGNDVAWVDEIAEKWTVKFKTCLNQYKNYRGGEYTIGLYTVSAHVPMGLSVGATPDGRKSGEPLADGGMSAVYGRDENGPTALLSSVSRINSENIANGSLLNMKFSPELFESDLGKESFVSILKTFVQMGIHHVQFNVVSKENLIEARKNPEKYRHLLVRVAGYTANYIDLSDKLQQEIIARTEYGA